MAAQLARPTAPGTGLEQDGIAQTSPLGTLGEWTGELDRRELAVKSSKNNELHKLSTWGAAPNPGIFIRHRSHQSGLAADLMRANWGSCGLWYCQTAGQNLQAIINSHQWLKKTGQRDRWQGLPSHADLKRHSDASARVSLAGCVPAVPASVFPRSSRMPQLQHSVTTA